MDAFEENLQTFNGTIYGLEMRESLHKCFELIRVEISNYSEKIQKISDRINALEGGG